MPFIFSIYGYQRPWLLGLWHIGALGNFVSLLHLKEMRRCNMQSAFWRSEFQTVVYSELDLQLDYWSKRVLCWKQILEVKRNYFLVVDFWYFSCAKPVILLFHFKWKSFLCAICKRECDYKFLAQLKLSFDKSYRWSHNEPWHKSNLCHSACS